MPQRVTPATPDQIARFGHIAAAVREALISKGMTPGEFNIAAGFNRESTYIYQIRSGKQAPSPRLVEALHQVLGINRSDLKPKGKVKMGRPYNPPVVLPVAEGVRVHDVLGFNLDNAGNARLRLDLTAPVDTVVPLLRMLLDMGLVISKESTTHE